ncbi:MAG: alpha/beta hydrolase [Pseudomonadota bacterium]
MLHGVGLRAEAWNAQIDALSARFAVIAPDMPGHGESPIWASAGGRALSNYVDVIADGLETPVWLAGHSMGALIALSLSIRHPRLVRGVAALNAIHRRPSEAAAAVRARAAALDGVSPADPTATLARWFGGSAPEAALEAEACRAWLRAADPAGYKAAYSVFAREDGPAEADLRRLAAPALFLTGDAEPNATPAMARAMAALAPKGAAHIVEGAAHMAPMTHAAEVSHALITFFEEADA